MSISRFIAATIGALFLVATVTFATAEQLTVAALNRITAFPVSAGDANILAIAALLAFVDGLAVVAIGILAFPVLKRAGDSFAQGYLALRIGEFAAVLLFVASPLLANGVGRLLQGSTDASATQPLLAVISGEHDVAFRLVYLLTGAAGCVLALALYRARLAPRSIAVLGMIGYPVLLGGTVLDMFGVVNVAEGVGLVAVFPGGLFELALPFWLIAKGFRDAGEARPAAVLAAT